MRRHWKKLALATVFLSLVGSFFYFGLHDHISLDTIRAHRETAVAAYRENPILVYVAFVAAFSAYNFFCLMGTWIVMIGAGAVFGMWLGALATGLAFGIGGTLHLWLGRYVFRDYAMRKWGDKLEKLNAEIERDGILVLFSLRLMSIIPYPTINFTMSLTPMKALPFFVVTVIADVIIGAVYANTGSHIAEIQSIKDVASGTLFASLALVGIFPLLVKFLLEKRRKRLAR